MKKQLLIAALLFVAACLFTIPALAASSQPIPMRSGPPSLTNLLSWWNLDETSGARSDQHGTNPLTDNNTVDYSAGKVSNAAYFVSANSESLSHADNVALSGSDRDITIVAWVRVDVDATKYIIAKDAIGASGREYSLKYDATSDKFVWQVSGDGTNVTTVTATTYGTLTLGAWYFVAMGHDATNNLISISVNAGTADTASHTTGIYNSTTIFTLGARSGGDYFSGAVDSVGFWNQLLTSDELTWLYNSGNGRSYLDLASAATATATNTPSNTPTITNTPTNTSAVTNTPTSTATITPSHTPSLTPTSTLAFDIIGTLPESGEAYAIERRASFGELGVTVFLMLNAMLLVLMLLFGGFVWFSTIARGS